MKVLIITGISEDTERIADLLKKAGIEVFSVVDAHGNRPESREELRSEWFAAAAGYTQAVVYFSFTDDELAVKGLELIKEDNTLRQTDFPLRGFVVPVEAHS